MSGRGIAVFGEGRHDIGNALGKALSPEELPALPELVHRLLGTPQHLAYTCLKFKDVRAVHGRGHKFAKKVVRAIRQAKRELFEAAAIVIDRDRKPDAERIQALRQGRDKMLHTGYPPCAVGAAVEAFDAWMIVDPKAVGAAGGDAAHCHVEPEKLRGKEGSRRHPKDIAADIFGSKKGLGKRYARVARHVDLPLLEKSCPRGFAPFADEVRERIGQEDSPG